MKIKTYLTRLWANQFLKGSLVVLAASNINNLAQFIFHFMSGRFLGKVYYGDLAAIISLLGIISIIQSAVGLAIIKSITGEHRKNNHNFIKWMNLYSLWLAVVMAGLVLIISPFIGKFLNITEIISVYSLAPLIFFFIMVTTQRSILQGLLNFNGFAGSLIVEAIVKVVFTFVLLILGWAILGALGAMLLGIIAAFVVTRISLNESLSGKKNERPKIGILLKYSSIVFIQGLSLTSMYSSDLILVKHFFSPAQAGIYASLAILGRIVFFGANPIVNVMFPIISKKHALNENYYRIFYLSLLLVVVIATTVTMGYFLFPQLAINLLYGKGYLEGASLLGLYGVFMTLLAVTMLLTQFYLSVNRTRVVLLFPLAAVLQVSLIWFFHNSLQQVIAMSIISITFLILLFLIYFLYQLKVRVTNSKL